MNTIGCVYVKCILASSDELWLQANRHFCHIPDTTIPSSLTCSSKNQNKMPKKNQTQSTTPKQKKRPLKTKKKGQPRTQRWWHRKYLNQATDENNHILASQPFAENKVTETCILENENLLQFYPIWTKKFSKSWNLNFLQHQCCTWKPALLHFNTLCVFCHNTGHMWKWQKKISVLSRRITGKWHLRNQRIWTSREVVRDCRSHFCIWLPMRYSDHSFTNNLVL